MPWGPQPTSTVATTNRIDVSEGGQGDQSLILDLRYGAMAAGKLAGPGLVVSLGSGTDTFKLIGSPYSERVFSGRSGDDTAEGAVSSAAAGVALPPLYPTR